MEPIPAAYSSDATTAKCWKCHGTGIKKIRKQISRSPSPSKTTSESDVKHSRKKKQLVDIPCSLCSKTGSVAAAPLTNTTRALPARVVRRGFVRPFNPPETWVCPGPAAAIDIKQAGKTLLKEGEMITALCGHWSIFQLVQGHRYTTDDLSCAAIAILEYTAKGLPRPKRHIDIGCGLGSVLLFVKWQFHDSLEMSIGIEAQEKHVELARKSVSVNMGNQDSNDTVISEVRHGDLRILAERNLQLLNEAEENSFDLVTGTPPYFPVTEGVLPTVQGRGMCSFELRGGVETYCLAAKRCLRKSNEARFVFVQTAIEIKRSERAIWDLGEMEVLERVDFLGSESKKDPLFVIFVCGWGERKEMYPTRTIAVRTSDGAYTREYHDMLVLVGKPPLQ